MWRWQNVTKRPLRRCSRVINFTPSFLVAPEERLLFERELREGVRQMFASVNSHTVELSQSLSPFTIVALQTSKLCRGSLKDLWPLLLLAINATDVSLTLFDARLLGSTSEMGYYCIRYAKEALKDSQSSPVVDEENYQRMRLVVSLVTRSLDGQEEEEWVKVMVSTIKGHKQFIPCHIMQLLLSIPVTPKLLVCIVNSELFKYGKQGINHHFFCSCANGLLANDFFFSPIHFHMMNAILMNIVDEIGISFDYHSVRWTPILNKLSRIYMRQCKGEALAKLHFKLLAVLPALETRMPLPYIVRCIGSLVDVGALKDDSRDIWQIITTMASLAVRLYGSVPENLHTIWLPLFKAAITLKPHGSEYTRVVEAYHVCASLGHPIVLDKTAFSQVVRLLINTLIDLSIEETFATMEKFYRFLLEHPSINFLWVTDSLVTILNELWKVHGGNASPIVQSFVRDLKEGYFPSMRLSGINLGDNPAIRCFFEKFNIVGKSDFWWCCGCGTQLPASAKRCLKCLRGCNVSWTCITCGTGHAHVDVMKGCACGAANPRVQEAMRTGVRLCGDCGDVLYSDECDRCKISFRERHETRECSFCKVSYSRGGVCCPNCYAANEEKKPMLWRCDACGEYNQWTWSNCQRCPGKRRVGCIITPLEPWVCGCGKRNHPCRTGCETCSRLRHGAYTCDSCSSVSIVHTTFHFFINSSRLRLTACQNCNSIHPRDRNVLASPFLRRHCHKCGLEYILANLSREKRCGSCNAFLSYNELNPFKCMHCEFKSPQNGFHCASCGVPRVDISADDVYVWRCHREIHDTIASPEPHVCGAWNYSWLSCCTACGEARAKSKHECRARFLPWVCAQCHHNNLPTDVVFCPCCDEGLQVAHDCSICGMPHLTLDCNADIVVSHELS